MPPALARRGADGDPVRGSVPSYASPESAVLALSRAVTYARWREEPLGVVPDLPGIDEPAARAVVDGLALDGTWIDPAAAGRLLACVGIHVWPAALVHSESEALAAAQTLGYPVAVKAAQEKWRHRLDVGAVRLDVADPRELVAAYAAVQTAVGGDAVYVQPMAGPGVSTVVRLVHDRSAGPLLSLRLGGLAVDLLVDPVVRTLPVTDLDARRLVQAMRGVALLTGEVGGVGSDVVALESLLLRLGRLAVLAPEIAELVLDPVLVQQHDAVPLHAGVRLLAVGDDPERGARRLGGSYAVL